MLGGGAIGLPLAACLTQAGRRAVAVRTSRRDVPKSTVTITVRTGEGSLSVPVETISLSRLTEFDGTIVVATKSYANKEIARALEDKSATGPLVVMQNGMGVEQPFLDANFSPIYRCVLFFTSEAVSEYEFITRPVAASPIGVVRGGAAGLAACVEELTTTAFPFRPEANIQETIWRKAIINAVFNSICPLLDADNGVFAQDEEVAGLAREVVHECVTLAQRLHMTLDERELMKQIVRISETSAGIPISTLQDIRRGRPTEIEFLNLEMVRLAAALQPPVELPRTELLGKMISAKAARARRAQERQHR